MDTLEKTKDLTIRPLLNADIALIEDWLTRPHVALRFSHPEDWLREIRGRRGEFAYIKHFIAEADGRPIGFCQYYDVKKAGDKTFGKVLAGTLSIDYMIGEESFLKKGYGKELVRLITEKAFYKGRAKTVVVLPEEENAASGGALLSNGYVFDEVKGYYIKEAPERDAFAVWDPWIGCKKYSEGCRYCYIYQGGDRRGIDVSEVKRTDKFYAPAATEKDGSYRYKSGTTFNTCFRSDFFISEADQWRSDAYKIIASRSDCTFLFLTKRIERFGIGLPEDWGEGYANVVIGVSCENQAEADKRLPILCSLPIKHMCITLSPLLEYIDISAYLDDTIEQVTVGGESGSEARPCDLEWIERIREQCVKANVSFVFKQTGSKLIKNGILNNINYFKQHSAAREAKLNFIGRHSKLY